MLTAFFGLHAPLVGLAFLAAVTGVGPMLPVLLTAFVSTLLGVGITLFVLHGILQREFPSGGRSGAAALRKA
ncbi:hypothetical protein HMH01_03370 [Halovulum dunhuangense]|uniref:Uncharacterized protein n=1 Tax=Halovulum dunhuangense TaxID=1505036 RepID=A0A849L079_9RHOB|nr:hypothetical protein [Halovulum dunhuangense]NNU79470.1 hypothetical protein [Halovulum dunhuangense]